MCGCEKGKCYHRQSRIKTASHPNPATRQASKYKRNVPK